MSLPGWVQFGGPNARGTRTVGDIIVSRQYVNGEPALVLWPKRPTARAGAFVICLSAAFKYDDDAYLVQQSLKAAEVMGMFPTKQTVYRIADAINSSLDDLVSMKPEPEEAKKSVGEGRILTGDGKSIDFELTH